jgi:hypothetical protein
VIVLIAIGFKARRYNQWQEDREHQSLLHDAKPMILREVAQKASVPEADLIDIVT